MTTTTKTKDYGEQIEAIRGRFPENVKHRAQGHKLRRGESARRGNLTAKDGEIREAAAATSVAVAEDDLSDLLVGDTAVNVEAGPTVAQLQSERDAIEADLRRYQRAILRQDELARESAAPVAAAVAKEMQPRHDELKQRAVAACEELVAVAGEMSKLYNALQDAGFTVALGGRIGPPDVKPLLWWIAEARKDLES
ncbi:MAG: hypothetical protein ACYS0K_18945 [Planctomycetota bacterium]|jgi:hypothetical protein